MHASARGTSHSKITLMSRRHRQTLTIPEEVHRGCVTAHVHASGVALAVPRKSDRKRKYTPTIKIETLRCSVSVSP